MKRLYLASFFLTLFFLFSCSQDEKIIDNTVDEWELLVSRDAGRPILSVLKMPEATVETEDVFRDIIAEDLTAPVEKIEKYSGLLYLFIPKEFKIEIVNLNTFERVAVVDFSADSLLPSDICFPNATDAYICHGNSSIVTLYDIKYFEKARQIPVGNNPVAIACSGNQIFTVNQSDASVSVIHDRKEAAVIPVFPAPTLIEAAKNGDFMIVLSLGAGVLDLSEDRTPSMISFIDVESRKSTNHSVISYLSNDQMGLVPTGLAVSKSDWAFISSEEILMRIDSDKKNRLMFVSRIKYNHIGFNPFRNELLCLREDNGNSCVVQSNQSTGRENKITPLPTDVYAIFPLLRF